MKKLISMVTMIAFSSTSAMPLLACSPDNSLRIAFIPSINSADVMKIVKPLEGLLKTKLKKLYPSFNRNVKITPTNDYETAGRALKDGKTDLAFLPIGTYTKNWGNTVSPNNYAAAAPLVIAQRAAMKPEVESKTTKTPIIHDKFEIQQKILGHYVADAVGIKTKKQAHDQLYMDGNSKDPNDVTSNYRSEILVNNNFFKNTIKDVNINDLFDKDKTIHDKYKDTIKKLFNQAQSNGKIRLLSSDTSGAGVIYPVQWMLQNLGNDNNAQRQISSILKNQPRATSYPDATQQLSNGDAEIIVGYTDIRADATSNSIVAKVYDGSSIIGLTDGILNDGIDYSKKSITDPKLVWALRKSFKELIEDPANKAIFAVYGHNNYTIPDSDSAADSVKFEENYNKDCLASDTDPNFKLANLIIQYYK